jgi:hypothetical protein
MRRHGGAGGRAAGGCRKGRPVLASSRARIAAVSSRAKQEERGPGRRRRRAAHGAAASARPCSRSRNAASERVPLQQLRGCSAVGSAPAIGVRKDASRSRIAPPSHRDRVHVISPLPLTSAPRPRPARATYRPSLASWRDQVCLPCSDAGRPSLRARRLSCPRRGEAAAQARCVQRRGPHRPIRAERSRLRRGAAAALRWRRRAAPWHHRQRDGAAAVLG